MDYGDRNFKEERRQTFSSDYVGLHNFITQSLVSPNQKVATFLKVKF